MNSSDKIIYQKGYSKFSKNHDGKIAVMQLQLRNY